MTFIPIGIIPDRCVVQPIIPDRGYVAVKKTIEESPKSIGIFVRERRLASGLTQQELGELAGVGTRLISELERGKTTLRMDAVNRVLRVFGRMLGQVEAPRDENTE
jgi:y4mF family transcriptional regulator